MSEQKFTPAPWSQAHRICDEEGNYSTQVFSAETGETIATLAWAKMPPKKVIIDGRSKIQTGTYREGNAKLIAAAPEMFEALKRVEAYLVANEDILAPFPTRSELDNIRAAMFKTGLYQYGD